jgi:two-component system, LytTR family, response regulator AlgR
VKVLIADDEAPARTRLRRLVEEIGGHDIAGEAANGREALLLSETTQPDVLLLDIRMPGMDGLEAARHLAALENPPAVIFTTAYGDHALEAFAAHAIDYLLKPIRKERLAQALARVRKLNRAQSAALTTVEAAQARGHICARVRGTLQLVPVSEIVYFLADQKYVTVCHSGGSVLIEESLKALETEFATSFTRIHRNALVAAAHIVGLERDNDGHVYVRLRGVSERLEVSRRHAAELRQRLVGGG